MFYNTSSVKIVRVHRLVEGESLWRPTPNRAGDKLLLPPNQMQTPGLEKPDMCGLPAGSGTVACLLLYLGPTMYSRTVAQGASGSEKCENGKRQGVVLPG